MAERMKRTISAKQRRIVKEQYKKLWNFREISLSYFSN
jgi:hypothetical protein